MAKQKTNFRCQACGYETPKWMGKCPGCHKWNTLVEELVEQVARKKRGFATGEKPVSIQAITSEEDMRMDTGITELNRVLGGGIVPGSLVLVGGDPGIGKSTLLLETSAFLAKKGQRVLYVSGEESIKQTKLRAERLKIHSEKLYVMAETDLTAIEKAVDDTDPIFIVVDSIQTIHHPEVASAPGSVAQVRECTAQLIRLAKTAGVAIFIVGHVTKEGAIAGPRLLEHMVDCVLYFEGARHHSYRLLRAVKNRFGSTNELGVFAMKASGLEEVANPSEIFLEERSKGASGSTVVPSLEGTRTIMVEIQALVSPTSFGYPRRTANGIDHNRVSLLMAVLEKRVGLLLQNQDAYLNVAGGVRLDEPAIDLAIATSIASSFHDRSTDPGDVIIGEIGLTGEVRRVSRIEQRINEARKLGFTRALIPEKNKAGLAVPEGIEVIGVDSIAQALEHALGGA